MATKSDFTPEQWRRLLAAPLLAAFAVSAADPSGLIGTLQESMASAGALASARANGAANALIRAVVDDLDSAEGRTSTRADVQRLIEGAELPDIRAAALAALRDVASILDARAPQDAAAFKDWLTDIARRVAAAATEAGFLGFGGEKVSAAERAALKDIDAALTR
ncbi:MAG: hypothetical protein ACR652_00975 [Methylocystis sp.]|uniref:hypothetical protein n=1 Tax=Methylocystis sp. TaxID=1911079 RepID=UPI003DA345F1